MVFWTPLDTVGGLGKKRQTWDVLLRCLDVALAPWVRAVCSHMAGQTHVCSIQADRGEEGEPLIKHVLLRSCLKAGSKDVGRDSEGKTKVWPSPVWKKNKNEGLQIFSQNMNFSPHWKEWWSQLCSFPKHTFFNSSLFHFPNSIISFGAIPPPLFPPYPCGPCDL